MYVGSALSSLSLSLFLSQIEVFLLSVEISPVLLFTLYRGTFYVAHDTV